LKKIRLEFRYLKSYYFTYLCRIYNKKFGWRLLQSRWPSRSVAFKVRSCSI